MSLRSISLALAPVVALIAPPALAADHLEALGMTERMPQWEAMARETAARFVGN